MRIAAGAFEGVVEGDVVWLGEDVCYVCVGHGLVCGSGAEIAGYATGVVVECCVHEGSVS
jgi:hypothetical protein